VTHQTGHSLHFLKLHFMTLLCRRKANGLLKFHHFNHIISFAWVNCLCICNVFALLKTVQWFSRSTLCVYSVFLVMKKRFLVVNRSSENWLIVGAGLKSMINLQNLKGNYRYQQIFFIISNVVDLADTPNSSLT